MEGKGWQFPPPKTGTSISYVHSYMGARMGTEHLSISKIDIQPVAAALGEDTPVKASPGKCKTPLNYRHRTSLSSFA